MLNGEFSGLAVTPASGAVLLANAAFLSFIILIAIRRVFFILHCLTVSFKDSVVRIPSAMATLAHTTIMIAKPTC